MLSKYSIQFFKWNTRRFISTGSQSIPSRKAMLDQVILNSKQEFDVLVIGGGSTGAGVALDAIKRGLNVVCVEREDFGSGTSSRSTKLLWGGSRYLVQALVSLFHYDLRLLRRPKETIQKFLAEFRMVMNCHRERKFLLSTQPHLTNWIPIAVPITSWFIWPPPFNYPPAAFGPLGLFYFFFKFYDALSGFTSPPSHIMLPSRAKRKFSQLNVSEIKYCPVFYEGQHDDARTNLTIAQTAALYGAKMLNYCNVIEFNKNSSGRVTGAQIYDENSKSTFSISAKSVIFCGGPFTDEIRKLENNKCDDIVSGAGGIHIVIPGYYAPNNFGLVDMATSDGRFLFYLPWEGHVLIGTTDHPSKPSMRPVPAEDEIQWLLHEASKYLSKELKMRRQDVLSAWSGVRPLAADPHADSTASVSRDHVVSYNPTTGTVFLAGGKWTTYREMAEDGVDKLIEVTPEFKKRNLKSCSTLQTPLIGLEGYSINLPIKLIQNFGIPRVVSDHLSKSYGGRAFDVIEIAQEIDSFNLLIDGFPYLEAEVLYAIRYEWAIHVEDILARRTRLAFLNKNAAIEAIPKILEIMSKELKWDNAKKDEETRMSLKFMEHFGGPIPSN